MGEAADVVGFDLDRVGAEIPQILHDLPGGSERLVASPIGIRATSGTRPWPPNM